ncbi:putative oxidoreductase [Nitrobacteraceae bacterium AZCC 1564]
MSTDLPHIVLLLGRLLLGGLFVFAGIRHMFLIPVLTEMIAARGVPFPRGVLLVGSAFQFIGGLLVIFGLFLPFAAFGLVLFTLTASVMLLNFWDMEGQPRQNTINVWLSNIAIIGGLMITAAQGM